MVKMLKGNKWKPLQLEGAFLNQDIENLIGIEELTDYNLADFNLTPHSSDNNKRKRKSQESELNGNKKPALEEPGKYVLSPKLINDRPKPKKKKKREVKVKVNVEVGTKDSTKTLDNPEDLLAWSNFGLPNELLNAISDQGFIAPTEIQKLTLPSAILGRRDILGAAETGSGKTLAFGLPILTGILHLKANNVDLNKLPGRGLGVVAKNNEEIPEDGSSDELEWEDSDSNQSIDAGKNKPLYALILTPTRELAVQIKNHLIAAAKYTDIKIAVVLGGMAAVKQERILSKGPEIVVATPGRLWELIQEGNQHLSQIDNIRFLAIDETDRMVERGHYQELQQLLDRLNSNEDRKKLRQNFIFSATLTMVHDIPKYLEIKRKVRGKKVLKQTPGQKLQQFIEMLGVTNPKIVDVTNQKATAEGLTECRITCPIEDKDYYLYYFLKRHPGRTLVFCNSIGCVKRLATLFNILECNPLPLHASMQQRQRLKNLERFRDDDKALLIATDVAARGLDIPQIEHVIHYQVPRTAENYVHRSGRTARATAIGITILIMEPTELKYYNRLCHTLGRDKDLPLFPIEDKMLSAVKDRVHLARDIDQLELKVKRSNSEVGWMQKAIDEMDIIVDEHDMPAKYFDSDKNQEKGILKIKRKQLASLIQRPLFPKGYTSKYPTFAMQLNSVPLTENGQSTMTAVDAMKSAMANYSRSKVVQLTPRIKQKTNRRNEKQKIKQQRRDLKKKMAKKKMKEGQE